MDTRTGEVNTLEEFEKKNTPDEMEKYIKEIQNVEVQMRANKAMMQGRKIRIGWNDKCPCKKNNPLKFKRCCGQKIRPLKLGTARLGS